MERRSYKRVACHLPVKMTDEDGFTYEGIITDSGCHSVRLELANTVETQLACLTDTACRFLSIDLHGTGEILQIPVTQFARRDLFLVVHLDQWLDLSAEVARLSVRRGVFEPTSLPTSQASISF